MCGIFGVFDGRRQQAGRAWAEHERDVAVRIRDTMAHRGPDGAGLDADSPGVLFGHRRLAILDLSDAAAQPMRHPSGALLVLNGEIYNYVELRAALRGEGVAVPDGGDTVVLLAALVHWGVAATVERIRGMFGFAFWDGAEVHLVRDPIGQKPIYVAACPSVDGGVERVFSSTFEAALRWYLFRGGVLRADPAALEHVIACGYLHAPQSAVEGVRAIPPATLETWSADGAQTIARPYHRHPIGDERRPLDRAMRKRLQDAFDVAVERRLRSDVPVATFLSGGLDSSLVTAAAARQHDHLVAYTVAVGDPGQPHNAQEVALAERIAAYCGVEHRILPVDAEAGLTAIDALVAQWGEPFGDASALPSHAISRLTAAEHRVVLTGDGGDEVQGGYDRSRMYAMRGLIHQMGLPSLAAASWRGPLASAVSALEGRHAPPQMPFPEKNPRLRRALFRAVRLFSAGADALTIRDDGLDATDSWWTPAATVALRGRRWREQMQVFLADLAHADAADLGHGWEFLHYLPGDLCRKVDVATMAHGLEARSPLLDVDFTGLSWSVRASDRVGLRADQTKRIVRMLFAQHLPDELAIPIKRGFSVPAARWMNTAAEREALAARARLGAPILDPWLDGERAIAWLAGRDAAGVDTGTARWRLGWLLRWGRWVETLAAEPVPAAS